VHDRDRDHDHDHEHDHEHDREHDHEHEHGSAVAIARVAHVLLTGSVPVIHSGAHGQSAAIAR
jgi:ABC-type Zn2+ transport system substrate-binding protein/surface adhesin